MITSRGGSGKKKQRSRGAGGGGAEKTGFVYVFPYLLVH
jgi:hypothetical protein